MKQFIKNAISNRKVFIVSVAVFLVLALTCGMTLAYLNSKTEVLTNTFTAAKVSTEVVETFDGQVKTAVNAKNTGTCNAYIRIQLISYRVDDSGNLIGGKTPVPEFTLGNGWMSLGNDCYVYTKPVAPGAMPANGLVAGDGIKLVDYSESDEGGKQVIDVLSEAIQATPAAAVKEAWGVTVYGGTITGLAS